MTEPERTTRRMLKEAGAWADDLPPVLADNLPAPRDLEAEYRDWIRARDAGLTHHSGGPTSYEAQFGQVPEEWIGVPAKRVEGWGEFKTTVGPTDEPPAPEHWMKTHFIVSGRGHGKTALLARLKARFARR